MKKNISIKQSPLFDNDPMLKFDEEFLQLTDKQRTDRFISRWMSKTDPITTYSQYFSQDKAKTLKLVKNNYKKFVIEENWTEYKFVMVLDYVFNSRQSLLNEKFLTEAGEMFEKNILPSQKSVEQAKKRKKRI